MTTPLTETYRAAWEAWRAGWEQWLAQPHNWLSAVAVNWLDDTPRRFDGTPGRFEPFDTERSLALGTVGWREHGYLSPGVVRFEHDGTPYELQVIVSAGRHTTVFADATSGDTTYPAGRALDIPAPAEDGTVTLDFNRAVNLPCAFGDFLPDLPDATGQEPLPVPDRGGREDARRPLRRMLNGTSPHSATRRSPPRMTETRRARRRRSSRSGPPAARTPRRRSPRGVWIRPGWAASARPPRPG
jgi:uncharacterized protein (DUF1684 family)